MDGESGRQQCHLNSLVCGGGGALLFVLIYCSANLEVCGAPPRAVFPFLSNRHLINLSATMVTWHSGRNHFLSFRCTCLTTGSEKRRMGEKRLALAEISFFFVCFRRKQLVEEVLH